MSNRSVAAPRLVADRFHQLILDDVSAGEMVVRCHVPPGKAETRLARGRHAGHHLQSPSGGCWSHR
eukprot:CAMPEP_0181240484 /NCGR_PEP_ID=MMETSP1096-20121128/40558_1 /TAXON_ID=156174 ORGANISM="Chrysochromulina ericina, Strain CCMP281" /NCGR_SAMPLE_ID=MMETSP1096 /ASSEMBLY_ACC=CAM_ASM_000453 /LENGTH=65 /DNA_ID=CAMNT_0023336383 /DNA_START=137 /DNA_END=334 /DNA_ORIENTATION=-